MLEGITTASTAASLVRLENHRRGAILPQALGEAQENAMILEGP
jgi:hypothetical protein